MTPPTLEEHRAWVAAHGRNYTDGPIRKHVAQLNQETRGGSVDNITRLIETKEDAA